MTDFKNIIVKYDMASKSLSYDLFQKHDRRGYYLTKQDGQILGGSSMIWHRNPCFMTDFKNMIVEVII